MLAAGAVAHWWVQTWNANGYGPWSDALEFSVAVAGVPDKARLISPTGSVQASNPTYVWDPVPSATWYQLWVNDITTSAGKIKIWYTAAQAGCVSGIDTCSVTPTIPLASGAAQWWVQTWNDFGYGPWSDGAVFTVIGDLVAYYPFTGNAIDESGKGNHGAVFGAALT